MNSCILILNEYYNCWGVASQTPLTSAPEDKGIWAISAQVTVAEERLPHPFHAAGEMPMCPHAFITFPSTPITKVNLRYLILKHRTLILFTAFSSVYSYHIKWLTMLLLSCPQRPVDILHKHRSQGWGSLAMLWLVQNRNLLLYSSQSERTSLSIHKTLHHKDDERI